MEAVWKQPDLPPHLSNISISDEYKADFLSVECGGKNEKNSGEGKEWLIIYCIMRNLVVMSFSIF